MDILKELVEKGVRLPSPPAIAVRILEAVKKDEASFGELARIIQSDPALSVRILKVANSAFYALPSKVDSIQTALSIMGTNVLKNIALSFVIADGLRGTAGNSFNFDFFWKRAVTAAVGAELVATRMNYKSADTFVTALLQDIGIAVMYFCMPDNYMKVLDEKKITGASARELEKQVFGFDHQEIGCEVLKHWGLPETIYMPILYHHKDRDVPEKFAISAMILFLADKISSVYHGGTSSKKIQELKTILKDEYDIEESAIETLIDAAASESIEVLSYFDVDPGSMKPYSELLQEANEELGKLNLTYEQLVMEYKEAKENAEVLAEELRVANDKLRSMAFRDDLTGLYNHRYFHQLMDTELHRAIRYESSFSLIIFDIDDFKKINDTYGHLTGDIVLRALSALAMESIRKSDFAARYGGEEFAVILPETDIKGASVMAERLRHKIEKMQVNAGGVKIRLTVSLGVTTYAPGCKIGDKSEIIDTADKALYYSKKTGKNKLSAIQLPQPQGDTRGQTFTTPS